MKWFSWLSGNGGATPLHPLPPVPLKPDTSDDPPDTLREGHMSMDERWRSVDARLAQIELILTDISAALVGQGYTLKTHIDSHAKDAKRTDHLRRVPTLSEEA